MGRVAVRQAIATLIQNAGINYVGTVYPARPSIVQEDDYEQTMSGQAVTESANGSACVIVVNLPSDDRQRRADTGRAAVTDTNIHDVALELWFASTGGDAMNAQLDYDAIVDSLFVLIRANQTPGGSSVVWSMGEFDYGVKHSHTEPSTSADGLTILISGVIRCQAIEWLAGSNV